jgi:hypothetical protein
VFPPLLDDPLVPSAACGAAADEDGKASSVGVVPIAELLSPLAVLPPSPVVLLSMVGAALLSAGTSRPTACSADPIATPGSTAPPSSGAAGKPSPQLPVLATPTTGSAGNAGISSGAMGSGGGGAGGGSLP